MACATGTIDAQVSGAASDSVSTSRRDSSVERTFRRVSGQRLAAAPAFTLEQSLQGKLAGVVVSMNDGAPWSDGQIQVRGVSTLVGDPSPLVIVDGVLATDTYLSNPSQGLAYLGEYPSAQSSARLRDFTPFEIQSVEVIKGPATARYGLRGANGVILITTRRRADATGTWRAQLRTGQATPFRQTAPRCFASVAAAKASTYLPRDSTYITAAAAANGGVLPCLAHQAVYFGHTGVGTDASLEYSAKVLQTGALLSVSRLANDGSISGSGASRTNVRLNLDRRIGSRLDVRVSSGHAVTTTERVLGSSDARVSFLGIPSWADVQRAPVSDSARFAQNPFRTALMGADDGDDRRTLLSAGIDYRIIRGTRRSASLSYLSGIDRLVSRRVESYSATSFSTTTTTRSSLDNHALTFRADQALRSRDAVTLMAGVALDRQQLDYAESSASRDDSFTRYTAEASNSVKSLFVDAHGTFLADRLDVGAGVRRDRFSALANGAQPAAFPSVTASYRVVSRPGGTRLGVRGGWGISGGMGAIGASPLSVQLSQPYATAPVTRRFTERRDQSELGLDLATWRNRLAMAATAFAARNLSLYMSVVQYGVQGRYSAALPDLADASVSGVEVSARMVAIDRHRIRWTAQVAGSHSSSKLTRPVLEYAIEASDQQFPVGRYHALLTNMPLTRIATNNQRVPGNAAPRFDASFANRLESGPLSLSVQLDWRSGGDIYSSARQLQDNYRTSPDFDQPAPDGNGALGDYRLRGRPFRQDSVGIYLQSASTVRIREAVLRYTLRPAFTKRALGASTLGISLQARNLALWTDSWAPDPEFSGLGTSNVIHYVDLARYPPMRQLFLGVDVGF